MSTLGKQQLMKLITLGSPSRAQVVGDKVVTSLVKRGLLTGVGRGGEAFFRITPAGLRVLADELETGRLEAICGLAFTLPAGEVQP